MSATIVVVISLVNVVSPFSAEAAERAQVEAFLEVTGFDVALDSIAMSATLAPQMLGLDEGDFGGQWTALAKTTFDTVVMRARATDILEATLDAELLAHAAEFYASELGQKLVEAENFAHLQNDDVKYPTGAKLLAEMKAQDDPKISLFRRMSEAIDPNKIGIQAMIEIQVRFILAASYAGVISLRIDEKGLRAALAEDAEKVAREAEINALQNNAFTYQDFSLTDLMIYTKALEDPRMMTVYELMNAVHFEVMSNRFEALAVRLGKMQPAQEL